MTFRRFFFFFLPAGHRRGWRGLLSGRRDDGQRVVAGVSSSGLHPNIKFQRCFFVPWLGIIFEGNAYRYSRRVVLTCLCIPYRGALSRCAQTLVPQSTPVLFWICRAWRKVSRLAVMFRVAEKATRLFVDPNSPLPRGCRRASLIAVGRQGEPSWYLATLRLLAVAKQNRVYTWRHAMLRPLFDILPPISMHVCLACREMICLPVAKLPATL